MSKLLLNTVDQPDKPVLAAGISETLDVVDFFVSTANAYNSAMEDGKLTLADLPLLIEPARKLLPAVQNIALVPSELVDIDFTEAQEIIDRVKEELDIDDQKAKEVIENAFKALYHIKNIVVLVG